MNSAELLKRVTHGWILLVGEFRGGQVEKIGFTDMKSGLKAHRVQITYLVERVSLLGTEIVFLKRRAPETVLEPEQVIIPLEKGTKYAFEIEGLKRDKGLTTAFMGSAEPELIE